MKTYKFNLIQDDDKIVVGNYFVINLQTDIRILSEQEAIVSKLKSKINIFKVIRTKRINRITAYICQCLTITNHNDDYFGEYENE